jgi:SET domain-containing protein
MLLVKTYLDKSKVHGLGVFAGQYIRKGTKIWRFVEGFDQFYTLKQFAKLPKQARDYLQWHGFRWEDEVLFSADYDSHMNHSEYPNTLLHNGYAIARRNIRKGEEITNDYREFGPGFCAAFLQKKKTRLRRKRG